MEIGDATCTGGCTEDLDPATPIVEPHCTVEAQVAGEGAIDVPECERDAGGYVYQDGHYLRPEARRRPTTHSWTRPPWWGLAASAFGTSPGADGCPAEKDAPSVD